MRKAAAYFADRNLAERTSGSPVRDFFQRRIRRSWRGGGFWWLTQFGAQYRAPFRRLALLWIEHALPHFPIDVFEGAQANGGKAFFGHPALVTNPDMLRQQSEAGRG
jgi:hypothetical protein